MNVTERIDLPAFDEYVQLLSVNSPALSAHDEQRRRLLALKSTNDGTWAISSMGSESFQPLSHWILELERGDGGYDRLVNTMLSVISCIQASSSWPQN